MGVYEAGEEPERGPHPQYVGADTGAGIIDCRVPAPWHWQADARHDASRYGTNTAIITHFHWSTSSMPAI
jgi:hypothetical protein